jgi:hypothetical protein
MFVVLCLGIIHLHATITYQAKIRELHNLILRQEDSFKKAQSAASKHYETIINEKEEVICFMKDAIDKLKHTHSISKTDKFEK